MKLNVNRVGYIAGWTMQPGLYPLPQSISLFSQIFKIGTGTFKQNPTSCNQLHNQHQYTIKATKARSLTKPCCNDLMVKARCLTIDCDNFHLPSMQPALFNTPLFYYWKPTKTSVKLGLLAIIRTGFTPFVKNSTQLSIVPGVTSVPDLNCFLSQLEFFLGQNETTYPLKLSVTSPV